MPKELTACRTVVLLMNVRLEVRHIHDLADLELARSVRRGQWLFVGSISAGDKMASTAVVSHGRARGIVIGVAIEGNLAVRDNLAGQNMEAEKAASAKVLMVFMLINGP